MSASDEGASAESCHIINLTQMGFGIKGSRTCVLGVFRTKYTGLYCEYSMEGDMCWGVNCLGLLALNRQ
jgi:hypothetical protein